MSFRQSIRFCIASSACLLLGASFVSAQAPAAKPKAPPAKPRYGEFASKPGLFKDARAATDHEKLVNNILIGRGSFDDAAKANLNKWYEQKLLLDFASKKNIRDLPKLRASLLYRVKKATSAPAAKHVKASILKYMRAYAQPKNNLHPAVRYNAMLVIGDLNDVELNSRDSQGRRATMPDPMMTAFDALMSEFISPAQIDAVRVAAQIGILRHAILNRGRPAARQLDNNKRRVTIAKMLELVNAPPPAGRTKAGHTWMQRRGIEIMAAFGAVGEIAQVNSALEKIVANTDAPMSLRCTAAEALSHWNPAGTTTFDALSLSVSLGRLGGQALVNELNYIGQLQEKEKLREQLRELIADTSTAMTGGSPGAPGAGGGEGMSQMGQMSQMMEAGYDEGGGEDEGGAAMDMSAFFEQGGEGLGGMQGMMPGGDSLLDSGPEDPRVTRSRRRLKKQLACIQAGLKAIAEIPSAAPQKEKIDTVMDAIKTAYASTDPATGDLPGLEESIKQGLGALAFLMPEVTTDPDSPLGDPSAAPGETVGPSAPAPDPGAGAPAPDPGAGATAPDPGAGATAPDPGAGATAPDPGAGAPAPDPGAGAAAAAAPAPAGN